MTATLSGLTLIELLLAVAILAFCLAGISLTYINMFVMSDISRDYTLATNAIQAKMEQVKRQSFDNLTIQSGAFNLTDFGFVSGDSQGYVEVSENFGNFTNKLTKVRVVACFECRRKLIGNSITNCTSSPVEAVTLLTR